MIRVFFLVLSLFFCTSPLISVDHSPTKEEFLREEEPTAEEKTTPLDSKTLLIRTVLLLAGLVGMLYGGAYLVRRMGGSRFSTSGEGAIRLVERQFISPKTAVWLLEIQDQTVVVVDGQNGVAIHSLGTHPTKETVS